MVIVLIGPMGCGKTTIGEILAQKLSWDFFDGDDFHPEENKLKMAEGIPLDDAARAPWLHTLSQIIKNHLADKRGMILACSALKKKYRLSLGVDQERVFSVFLKGSFTLLYDRISDRSHEYMAASLLQSQLDTLEEPESGLSVDISDTVEQICQTIINKLSVS
jgi:carbohydrate kinase (thermoresistant glucokinase family)